MAKCIVPSCRSNNRELFCSPDDKNKLRKWKQILKVEENSFLVCDIHFSDKFVKFEKFLTQDAFPSILVEPEEYSNNQNNDYCQSCLKEFEASSTKVPVSEKIQKIFLKRTTFEIKLHSFLCDICHEKFIDFESFVSAIKAKHELKTSSGIPRIKSEKIDLEDDDECPELYPIQNLEITHLDNGDPEILREVLGRHEIVPQQKTSPPKNVSNDTRLPKLQKLKIEPGRRSSLLIPKLQEIERGGSSSGSNNLLQSESTNSPMVVIPDFHRRVPVNDSLSRNIRSRSIHENKQMTPELNTSVQHDHSFIINAHNVNTKRRNSVASTADLEETTSNKRFRSQFIEAQAISCNFCPMQFSNIAALKIHLDEVHKASPLKSIDKPENFRCTDCNEGFTSYYYLRKHKDSCEYSLRFKCSQQYCRFRAATVEEINNHMLDAHFSQTRCKICKIDFETQEEYKMHEAQEHVKKERGRKPKTDANELKKILLHRESTEDDTKVQCLQCSELISPEMLSIHIKQHLDESN